MSWEEGKAQHLKLSDVAAAEYKRYAAQSLATRAYMRFEEDTISAVVHAMARNDRAIDVGCGEGRISFHLAQYFTEVVGYDMSPSMISAADEQRLTRSHGNVRFAVRDVETELLGEVASSSTDLVMASFGMGSFFADPDDFIRETHRVLRPGGTSVVSFYNKASILNRLNFPDGWGRTLAARVDGRSGHGLLVNFAGQQFDISAHSYTPDGVFSMLSTYFTDVRILTYPCISTVLPHSVTSELEVQQLCDQLDRVLAPADGAGAGAYILALAKKPVQPDAPHTELRGHARLLRALEMHQVVPRVIEHGPIGTMEDVEREVGVPRQRALKSVLFRVSREYGERDSYALCVVSAEKTVDAHKLAAVLCVGPTELSLASPVDCEKVTGFPAGALSPMGMPKDVPVILDERVAFLEGGVVWCGSGRRTESFALPLSDVIRVAAASVREISTDSATG